MRPNRTHFDVRIPTYERPNMLKRAIDSLQAQTFRNWTATIFDNSSSSSAASVVRSYGDVRLRYVRNQARLGAAANIDQCFSSGGQGYGCVLEDDNFWLPNFLLTAAERLDVFRCGLLLINQRVFVEADGLRPVSMTTRGEWFSDGIVQPEELRARLLFMEGLSNGGLVWDLGGTQNLRVGALVKETGLHEACRSLLIDRPFLFVGAAEAVYTEMRKEASARANERGRMLNRGMQSIRRYVMQRSKGDLIGLAIEMAERKRETHRLAQNLAYCGKLTSALRVHSHPTVIKAFIKGSVLKVLEPDPCAEFLDQLSSRSNRG